MSNQVVSVVYCRMCGSRCEAGAATKVGNGYIGYDCCGYGQDDQEQKQATRNHRRQKQLNRVYNRD